MLLDSLFGALLVGQGHELGEEFLEKRAGTPVVPAYCEGDDCGFGLAVFQNDTVEVMCCDAGLVADHDEALRRFPGRCAAGGACRS